jgi:hypothetical protein
MKVPQSPGPGNQSSNSPKPGDYLSSTPRHQPPINPITRPDLPWNQNDGAVRPIVASPPVVPLPP